MLGVHRVPLGPQTRRTVPERGGMGKKLRVAVIAAFAVLLLGVMAAPSFAASGGATVKAAHDAKNGGPVVAGSTQARGQDAAPSVVDAGALPFTGAELTLFVLLGAAAVGAGFVLIGYSRGRRLT